MCILTSYQIICTDCRRMFYDGDDNSFFESPEEAMEESEVKGWHCKIRVPNGSDWDFCPSCYERYTKEITP